MILNFFYEKLIDPDDYLLISFSGGPDSLACLHYLSTIHDTKKLAAFYLHHGLRQEADAEVIFCKDFCEKLGVTFYTDKVDISALAHEQKKSIEQVGREVRYAKLAELVGKLEAKSQKLKPKVVTAHHLDDQVESVLMQIFSGTSGLRVGIAEKININEIEVIRPLLQETKEKIFDYCEQNSLEFVTDVSNFETDFKRNKLRNIIIPMIKKIMNPNLEKAIERYKTISDEMSSYLDEQLDVLHASLSIGNAYNLLLFQKLHPFLQKESLKRKLVEKGISITTGLLEELIEQLNSSKPNIKYSISKDYALVKEYKVFKIVSNLEITKISTPLVCGENIVDDKKITIYLDTMCVVDKHRKSSVCLDADKIDVDSLVIRNKEFGDSFVPLGMQGSKKLKDYFIDKKVAASERAEVLVVEHTGGIIWVVGYEIDDRVKVTEETKSFLVIEFTLPSDALHQTEGCVTDSQENFPLEGKMPEGRKGAREEDRWFINYAESFYKDDKEFNKNIKLKIDHTFRVVSIIKDICEYEGLSEKDKQLAETIALYHDIGRFEQLKRYNTFADILSVDHALLALDICENYNLLDKFNELDACLIEYAIKHHNKLRLPSDASPLELLYASLIRDADKVDIYKTLINHFESWDGSESSIITFGLTTQKQLTPEAVDLILKGEIVEHKDMRTAYDFLLMLIGWLNDLNFDRSLQLIIERGYLESVLKFIPEGKEKDKISDWVNSIIS